MYRRLGLALVLAASVLAIPAAASAHTGSITSYSACEVGTTVSAHLDENVAASATWALVINGVLIDDGDGPGPRDLGPYKAGHSAGTADLQIDFEDERNIYRTSWDAQPVCPVRLAPRASIHGPFLDPVYYPVFDNSRSDVAVRFDWSFVQFSTHTRRHIYRTVAAHGVIRGADRHVLGRSLMSITARGRVLASERAAAGGNYGPVR